MTTHTSISEPEVEFEYFARPFSETGSNFISAMHLRYFIEIW